MNEKYDLHPRKFDSFRLRPAKFDTQTWKILNKALKGEKFTIEGTAYPLVIVVDSIKECLNGLTKAKYVFKGQKPPLSRVNAILRKKKIPFRLYTRGGGPVSSLRWFMRWYYFVSLEEFGRYGYEASWPKDELDR